MADTKVRVYHFSVTPDDFVYSRQTCTNYCKLNIPGLEEYDNVEVEVYKSLYSFNKIIKTDTLYLSVKMKPYKVIHVRIVVTKGYNDYIL